MSAPISLVDTAREIEQASQTLAHRANAQLEVIAQQMRHLQQQAREILEQTDRDLRLHRAECRCRKIIGNIYHLYERADGSSYFSLLSPADHGGAPPHLAIGSYRLEADQSWQLVSAAETVSTPDPVDTDGETADEAQS